MRNRAPHIILLLVGTLLFASCYTYRYVPEGEYVLYKNQLEVTMADSSEVTDDVNDALRTYAPTTFRSPTPRCSASTGCGWA